LNLSISKILYFGDENIDNINRTLKKGSGKPPKDYINEEHIKMILKGHFDGQIKYIDVSGSNNKDLIEKYNIPDSHTWILEYNNGTYDSFENDIPLKQRISEIKK